MFGYVIRTIILLSAALAVQATVQAPSIMLHASLEAAVGSSVTIDCVARGVPRPTVKLHRNGVFIPGQEAAQFPAMIPDLGGAKYRFTAVQGSGGPYECLATNGIADSNGNTNITKLINVIITGISSTTTSSPQTVSLSTASSTASTPEPTSEINTGISPTTTSAPQTVSLSTASSNASTPDPTSELNTDPAMISVTSTTKKTVTTPVNKNSVSGSNSSCAPSLLVVLPMVIAAFFLSKITSIYD